MHLAPRQPALSTLRLPVSRVGDLRVPLTACTWLELLVQALLIQLAIHTIVIVSQASHLKDS